MSDIGKSKKSLRRQRKRQELENQIEREIKKQNEHNKNHKKKEKEMDDLRKKRVYARNLFNIYSKMEFLGKYYKDLRSDTEKKEEERGEIYKRFGEFFFNTGLNFTYEIGEHLKILFSIYTNFKKNVKKYNLKKIELIFNNFQKKVNIIKKSIKDIKETFNINSIVLENEMKNVENKLIKIYNNINNIRDNNLDNKNIEKIKEKISKELLSICNSLKITSHHLNGLKNLNSPEATIIFPERIHAKFHRRVTNFMQDFDKLCIDSEIEKKIKNIEEISKNIENLNFKNLEEKGELENKNIIIDKIIKNNEYIEELKYINEEKIKDLEYETSENNKKIEKLENEQKKKLHNSLKNSNKIVMIEKCTKIYELKYKIKFINEIINVKNIEDLKNINIKYRDILEQFNNEDKEEINKLSIIYKKKPIQKNKDKILEIKNKNIKVLINNILNNKKDFNDEISNIRNIIKNKKEKIEKNLEKAKDNTYINYKKIKEIENKNNNINNKIEELRLNMDILQELKNNKNDNISKSLKEKNNEKIKKVNEEWEKIREFEEYYNNLNNLKRELKKIKKISNINIKKEKIKKILETEEIKKFTKYNQKLLNSNIYDEEFKKNYNLIIEDIKKFKNIETDLTNIKDDSDKLLYENLNYFKTEVEKLIKIEEGMIIEIENNQIKVLEEINSKEKNDDVLLENTIKRIYNFKGKFEKKIRDTLIEKINKDKYKCKFQEENGINNIEFNNDQKLEFLYEKIKNNDFSEEDYIINANDSEDLNKRMSQLKKIIYIAKIAEEKDKTLKVKANVANFIRSENKKIIDGNNKYIAEAKERINSLKDISKCIENIEQIENNRQRF